MTTDQELLNMVLGVVDTVDGICESGDYDALDRYLEDALDLEYSCNSRKEYLGARIAVSLGGPNIYINTRYGVVEGYWGGSHYERHLGREAENMLYNYFEEIFDSF